MGGTARHGTFADFRRGADSIFVTGQPSTDANAQHLSEPFLAPGFLLKHGSSREPLQDCYVRAGDSSYHAVIARPASRAALCAAFFATAILAPVSAAEPVQLNP